MEGAVSMGAAFFCGRGRLLWEGLQPRRFPLRRREPTKERRA
ncbi:hypothetical protein LG3211_4565 [Lysobacter gummosus]|nr:hypothetical protein LG3211_4565 [Lysobacter gummosus]